LEHQESLLPKFGKTGSLATFGTAHRLGKRRCLNQKATGISLWLPKPGRLPMPDRETIRLTLIELLEADKGEKFPGLEDSQKLREELGLDSLDVVSIVSQIERRFRIRLTHEELQDLVTAGDVLDLLQTKLVSPGGKSAAA
jgi:acyl carrier protein